MLDAYIIERIRREREADRANGSLIPLRIEVPEEGPPPKDEAEPVVERGSVVIDFSL